MGNPKAKIYVFLDACHMKKLVQNTTSDWQIQKNEDDNTIQCQFIKKLHQLQKSEGLHLAIKLWAVNIKLKPQKMSVNLAAQALSLIVQKYTTMYKKTFQICL